MFSKLSKKLKSSKGLISEFFKSIFKQARRPELYNKELPYDKNYTGTAYKVLRKFNLHNLDKTDVSDMIMDVLLNTMTVKFIKSYRDQFAEEEANQKGAMLFFQKAFERRMINESMKKIRVLDRERQMDDSEEDQTDKMDRLNPNIENKNPTSDMELRELIKGLRSKMKKKGDKYIESIFDSLVKGKNNKETAKDLGISPAAVSQKLQSLRTIIKDFAVETGNDVLFALMEKAGQFKKHSRDDELPLKKIFDLYKKKVGARSTQSLMIKRTKVKDKGLASFIDEAFLKGNKSPSSVKSELEEFDKLFEEENQDVIDNNGILTILTPMNESSDPREMPKESRTKQKEAFIESLSKIEKDNSRLEIEDAAFNFITK